VRHKLTWHAHPLGKPCKFAGPIGAPSLSALAHCLLPPPEKTTLALTPMFLLTFVRFFISLLGAPFVKLFREIAPWYVTPLVVQLVFVLVDYVLHILLLLVTMYMSLHVEFVWFKIVLLHDIASRHLWE
jgi:hypothetical protein